MFSKCRSFARTRARQLLWLILVLPYVAVCGQTPQAPIPTVTFTLDFPGSEPSHYVISMSSDGHASYVSNGKLNNDSESDPRDPWRIEFVASPPTNTRIFDLAKRAHYFEGEIDSGKKHLASTGTKILAYRDAQKNAQATYNYSTLSAVQELTAFFQNLSTTLEFGRKLDYYLRYQKLALDEELKQMEEMSNRHQLEEVSAVAPVLQKVADDPAVLKVVRARALRLLQLAGPGSK